MTRCFRRFWETRACDPERLGQRSRWAVWSYAARRWLPPVCWPFSPGRDATPRNQAQTLPQIQLGKEVAHQPPSVSRDLTPLLGARRDLDEAAMPRFVWPQENLLSASTPLNLLD